MRITTSLPDILWFGVLNNTNCNSIKAQLILLQLVSKHAVTLIKKHPLMKVPETFHYTDIKKYLKLFSEIWEEVCFISFRWIYE